MKSSIYPKGLHRYRSSFLIVVLMGLISLTISACDAMNERIPDSDKEFSTIELKVNNQMTALELANVADGLIHNWQPQAYLHDMLFVLTYDGLIQRAVFDYVSKKRFLWHERQAVALVIFDFENEKVIFHAADVNSSGPPDSRLNLSELDIDIHSIVASANAQGGTEYCERIEVCSIVVWLDNSTWILSYGPPGEMVRDLEIKINAKK